MLKKVRYKVSIVKRLTLLMLSLGAIALLALSLSVSIANDTKGSAYMVNQLGLLRMKSYKLLSMIPLEKKEYFRLDLFASVPLSTEYRDLLIRYQLLDKFSQLQVEWTDNLVPLLKNAQSIEEVRYSIDRYVQQIDSLVHHIDQKTENQLQTISRLQLLFMLVIIFFLVLQIYYLRKNLLAPWRQLLKMAEAISRNDISERFKLSNKHNEFDILGQAFNEMSQQIELQYQSLEQRVKEKTAELQHKNSIVSFLYQVTKQFHTSQPLCERFLAILHQLEGISPLSQFQIRFYETEDLQRYQEIGYDNQQKLPYCQNSACSACLIPAQVQQKERYSRYWYLQDNQQKYGLLIATLPKNTLLTAEQEDLVMGIVEQMTMAIALDRQIERQKQYLLMKERSAMARELHDSIAQSLSCIKIHLSCLQMQTSLASSESIDLLGNMKKEINSAYSQLRELITSFRLRLNQTGFYASLQELIKEFNKKLNFPIQFNYQLPLNVIDSKYAIHLLQIIREALNNIYKHADATSVMISTTIDEDDIITIIIEDNGIGMQQTHTSQDNHYGLIIMRDRVELLNGNLVIESFPDKGTKIVVTFRNTHIPFTVIEG